MGVRNPKVYVSLMKDETSREPCTTLYLYSNSRVVYASEFIKPQ